MTDDIEEQRQALRSARNDAERRSNAFASTTPIPPGRDVPVMPPEGLKAYEELLAARKDLEEFENLHPRAF